MPAAAPIPAQIVVHAEPWPAVLSTKEATRYVGGPRIFAALATLGLLPKPLTAAHKLKTYRRDRLDHALELAEAMNEKGDFLEAAERDMRDSA